MIHKTFQVWIGSQTSAGDWLRNTARHALQWRDPRIAASYIAYCEIKDAWLMQIHTHGSTPLAYRLWSPTTRKFVSGRIIASFDDVLRTCACLLKTDGRLLPVVLRAALVPPSEEDVLAWQSGEILLADPETAPMLKQPVLFGGSDTTPPGPAPLGITELGLARALCEIACRDDEQIRRATADSASWSFVLNKVWGDARHPHRVAAEKMAARIFALRSPTPCGDRK